MKKFILALCATAVFCVTDSVAGPELIQFPAEYKSTFTQYATINRTEKKQVVFTFANKAAVDSAVVGQPLAEGSVLVMEVYNAKLDKKGEPTKDDKGFYIKDAMAAIVVMEKREGWGNAYPAEFRNGDWEYAKYKTDKDKSIVKDSENCLKCHKKMEKKDFIFSFDELVSTK